MFYYGPHVKTVVLSSHAQCRQGGLYFFKYRPLYAQLGAFWSTSLWAIYVIYLTTSKG